MKRFVFACGVLLALAAVLPAAAFAAGARTLVVRGLVARADGKAAEGARVTAKGAMNVSATVDERGRYSLQVPMGSAASLRGGAFRVEVRAEHQGRKLALASGAPALAIEVAFVPGTTRLRVRSNSPSATAAVITAFAQEGVPTAWVDADFGGAVRASGDMTLNAEDEVTIANVAPAPGTAPAAPERAKPEPVRTPPPIKLKPGAPPPASTPSAAPAARPKPAAPAAAPDSAARARAAAEAARLAAARESARDAERERARAARHSRDSLAAVRRAERREAERKARAERAAHAAPAGKPAASSAAPAAAGHAPARRDSAAAAPSAPPVTPAATVTRPVLPGTTPGSRVVPIEAFAPPPGGGGPDTCACRLRGTVEVEWEERPLEKNVLVELSLEGPARQETAVDLYMGPPREFRLGPLPCGDYRLVVRPRGRLRYSLVRGDSVLVLRCDGHTQQRVVLTPLGR
ncbi:MAG: hypothetical protein U0704_03410 [Candidatus Eisenbacteria bacterium]